MLSNRRSNFSPASTSDRYAQDNNYRQPSNRVNVCNPKPTWRRTGSFSATPPSAAYYDAAAAAGAAGAAGAAPPPHAHNDEPHCQTPSVLTSTTAEIPGGYAVKRTIGSIHGTTTGALPKDGVKLWAKAVCGMGAEVRNLTALLYALREVATERMVLDCVSRGGNAVVGLGFAQSEIMGCVTVSVQGTAVFVEAQPRVPPPPREERKPFEQ